MRNQEEQISGGKFVNPGLLPPLRTYRLQGRAGLDYQQDYHIGAMSALVIGDCYIRNILFHTPAGSNSAPVTAIPAGDTFDFSVDWKATDVSGSLLNLFAVCIVWWEGDTIDPSSPLTGYFKTDSGYETAKAPLTVGLHPTWLGWNKADMPGTYVMPNRNIVMHFNMFINDNHQPAQDYPDYSIWGALKK